ncbi:MAG TPA: penicillin-binding transpeptidase domain-containing protein [Polyangiales bacterium]|nr:penicillin-binding transpeptidase domain-containing protein [Polyangiales bacterium]
MKTKTTEPTAEQLARKEKKRRVAARRLRVYVLAALLGWGAFKVVQRAYEIQVAHPENHQRDYKQEIELEAKRGNIYDRRGAALAVSVDLDSVFVDPLALRTNEIDLTDTARTLVKVLGGDTASLLERMGGKRRFVWIKRRITPAESAALAETGLLGKGIGVRKESRRFYPNLGTAAHILGFIDDQGHGVEGLERAYETRLRGATDKVKAEFDARGGVVFAEEALDGQSAQGQNLTLTIDREIQVIAERELELGVRAAEARAGHVVVMDPATGEILALANYPTFNPNAPGSGDASNRRNRAVQDRFEPGSVIKTFTIAGALASGAISPSQQINCENGAYVVGDSTIHDTHRYGVMTPGEILAHSSNIGTAKIGAAMGKEGLYKYLRKFGFGARTEVELPAETEGVLRNYKKWYEIDAATAAFGQGMSITNLQLATAMSAVANGGKLVKPMIVANISDVTGKVVEQFTPSVKRQVVPASTAHLVTDMLTGVTTSGGTGEAAALEGYLVAGKTGTAQKADPRGGYADDSWTATFVGFAPAQRPKLVVSVVIDEPVVEHYGGLVAGPVFKRITAAALRHMGVSPDTTQDKLAEMAKAASERRAAAESQAVAARASEHREPGQQLSEGQVRVPELRGQGARAALNTLARVGLTVTVAGTGAVVEQKPAAGSIVNLGSTVHTVLQRPGTSAPSELALRKSVRAESESLVSMASTHSSRIAR